MNPNQHKTGIHKTVEPIAIVGMACRFPGAASLKEFWQLLSEGRDTITEMPDDRWDHSAYYDPDLSVDEKTNQRHASFLKNIHDFDPLFFNISPAEAVEMNPSQKLMLELVWEAIENSSMPYQEVQGRKVGVYVGNIWSDFEHLRKHKNAAVTSHSAVGQSSNIIANRVSFCYGFTGPSLVVDTGCSSSLVALHLACQSLWDQSTEMSIVGGINHILDPDQYILLSKFGGLSSKGKCSTFDQDGDGFVRGEGAGVLFLKKLSHAERDGDKILALIRGTAMNNNGHNVNLPATSVTGQMQVLEDAYSYSGISPKDIHYVEAHGTGTKLGDPTETKALGTFFREGREGNLKVGSVKTNIGHLEAAAGVAGLIKVVLAMHNRQLPPSLNFKTPNAAIAFEELKLQVQDRLGEWPTRNGETLKAGINSFGWGGTNAHTIIEEYRVATDTPRVLTHDGMFALPVSAKSEAALQSYVRSYKDLLTRASDEVFKNTCIAAAVQKPHFDYNKLFVAAGREEMIQVLENFLSDHEEVAPFSPLSSGQKLVMVFPGQGSQWLGMARDLFATEPVFRKAIENCDAAFRAFTDWSLREELFASEKSSRLNEIDVIQPALSAVQIALAHLWMSWGITPDAVVGHSMGEVAAAFISGSINLEDAARIICTRSKLMKTLSGKGGAMAVTELSVEQAHEVVKRFPELSVAVSNSPKSTVLAGDQQAITNVLAELESAGLFAKQVKVDVASHSRQMDSIKEILRTELHGIQPKNNSIRILSTVRGGEVPGTLLDADYWVTNLRESVQFSATIQTLMSEGHVVFIEASPHPVLINAINECADHLGKRSFSIASVLRDKPERESIFRNLADLYQKGYCVDWKRFYHTSKAPDVELPPYAFQRERFEIADRSGISRSKSGSSKFPILGKSIQLAANEEFAYWQTEISLGSFPYISDHQVNEMPVLPGAAYAEMLFEAVSERYAKSELTVTKLEFLRSVSLNKDENAVIQLRIGEQGRARAFAFYSKSGSDKWEVLARGELLLTTRSTRVFPEGISGAPEIDVEVSRYYHDLKKLGLQYGIYFQGLRSFKSVNENEVHFSVAPDDRVAAVAGQYIIHPAILDACFQPLFYSVLRTYSGTQERTTFLTEIGEIELFGKMEPAEKLYGVMRTHPLQVDEQRGFINVTADVIIRRADHTPLLSISGLKGKVIDTSLIEKRNEKLRNWLYKVNWIRHERVAKKTEAKGERWIVFGDPYGVSDILLDKMHRQEFATIHVTPANGFSQLSEHRYTINYAQEQDYSKLLNTIFEGQVGRVAGIIHIGSMCYTWQDPYLTADIVEEHQTYGSVSFMYLHQQLAALSLPETPRLVIVTNGIQSTSEDIDAIQPVHSPLWGMAKVMFNELTQYKCRYVDLSANPSLEELDQLLEQLVDTESREQEVALRGVHQYVPRLGVYRENDSHSVEPRGFTSSGTYLITGFKGLGFVFVEWMIRQGARNFALVSRSGDAPQEILEKIEVLKQQGCAFNIFRADAGVYSEIKTVIDQVEHSMPALRGVVHAAGLIEARTLTDLNQAELLRILNPKVKGAWNLHLLTMQKSLDCFILFSSASTLIGLSGQGSYVAANAFLDTLANSRQRMGLPGMSINWGVIKDVGMVANKEALEKYARAEGFEPVSMQDAMDVFHAIYDSQHTQIGIVRLHPETMANYYSSLSQTPYFKGLLAKEAIVQAKETRLLDKLAAAGSAAERTVMLEDLVTQMVSKIVKTPASRIRSSMTFKGLGIDSLMAIQLRNMLEKNVDLKLSVAMFWAHPSIHEYATFLTSSLAEQLLIKNLEDQSAQAERSSPGHWFVRHGNAADAKARLFCFHDAGGDSSLYHAWPEALGNEIEVIAVEMPGRGRRMNETPYSDLSALIKDLTPVILPLLDKPFTFFGHSMGGLVAFEITRALKKTHNIQPRHLFISSTPGLTTYTKREVDHTLQVEELTEIFPHLHRDALADDELHRYLIDLMRGDLRLLGGYRYVETEPLDLPITVIHGDADERVRPDQALAWKRETTSNCTVITRPGGHRYIDHDRAFLGNLVKKTCLNIQVVSRTV